MTTSDPKRLRRIAAASASGTIIEFYDFAIFGTAAVLVFSKVFFPSLGSSAGMAVSLATVGVAFVARPFGSILFGHFGDRLGRKVTLVSTLLIMGGATVAIGLTPSADTIGPLAPVIIVLLRVLQGIAVGGEWAGASLLTAEHAPAGKRGFYGLFPQLGPSVGFMLACATFLGLSMTMSDEAFLAWGWRIPFLASFVLVVLGLYIRLSIAESDVFKEAMKSNGPERFPLGQVMSEQWRQVVVSSLASTYLFGLFYVGVTFLTSYATSELGLERSTVLGLNIIGGAALVATTILGAWLSDRIGRKRVSIIGSSAGVLASLAVFPIIDRGDPLDFLLGLSLLMAAVGIGYGVLASYLPELFATRYRYTGAGVSYNLASVLGGAVTPVLAATLMSSFGSIAIGVYLAILSLIGLVCISLTKDTTINAMAEEPERKHFSAAS
ncbi:MFS transporter [Rhodococcus globerulus]|uniref:MFS transporter n=1 Tax=Rhodococcus globerulus TaxID=33008 RepID=A0ABU4C433_RHOGO|nr:MFS transporter [Rhodococcus globerulus]MDV6271189.1 MFS transporter [Rhodococcus globerulus]